MLAYPVDQLLMKESGRGYESSQCIVNCLDCKKVCLETVVYCSQTGGPLADLPRLQLLLDCAMICEPSAYFVARGSYQQWELVSLCAQVCHHCAEQCQGFAGHAQLQDCARACRRCAESCETVSSKSFASQ